MFVELITSLNEYKQTNNIYALQMFKEIKQMIQNDLVAAYEMSQTLIENDLNLFRNSTSFFQFILQHFNLVEINFNEKGNYEKKELIDKDYSNLEQNNLKIEIDNLKKERDELISKEENCKLELDNLKSEMNNLRKERDELISKEENCNLELNNLKIEIYKFKTEQNLNNKQQAFYKDFYLGLQEIYETYKLDSNISINVHFENLILENQNTLIQRYDFYYKILSILDYTDVDDVKCNDDYEHLILKLLSYDDLLEKLKIISIDKTIFEKSSHNKTVILDIIDEINDSHLHFYQQLIFKLFNENVTLNTVRQYQTLILEMLDNQLEKVETQKEELKKQIEALKEENKILSENDSLSKCILDQKQKIHLLNSEKHQFMREIDHYKQLSLNLQGAYEAINKKNEELKVQITIIETNYDKKLEELQKVYKQKIETNNLDKKYYDECLTQIETLQKDLTKEKQNTQKLQEEKDMFEELYNTKKLNEDEYNKHVVLKNLFLQFLIYHFVLYYKSLNSTFNIDRDEEYKILIEHIEAFESCTEDNNILFDYIIHQMYALLGSKQSKLKECQIESVDMKEYIKEATDFIKAHYLNETVYDMCKKYNLEYTKLNLILETFSEMTNLVLSETDKYQAIKKIVNILQQSYSKSLSQPPFVMWLARKLKK